MDNVSHSPSFTPGPWDYDLETGEIIATDTPDGPVVLGRLYGFESELEPEDEVAATARLVAAAPALFANLRYALWCLENPGIPPTPGALDNMRAALHSAAPEAPHGLLPRDCPGVDLGAESRRVDPEEPN